MSVPIQPSQPVRNEAGRVFSSIPEQTPSTQDCLNCVDDHSRSQALDPEIFASLRELLSEPVLEQTYRGLLEQTRDRLRELAGQHDPRIIRETAHSIRGAASMLGAVSLAGAAGQLEDRLSSAASRPAIGTAPELSPRLAQDSPDKLLQSSLEKMAAACFAFEAALRQENLTL